jgi:hypothetical protein
MTEQEWLACDDVQALLWYLQRRTSERKLRCFAIACCWQLEAAQKIDELRKALAAAERYADGRIGESAVANWRRRVWLVLRAKRHNAATRNTCRAVSHALWKAQYLHDTHWSLMELAAKRSTRRTGPQMQEALQATRQELVPLLRDVIGNPFAELPKVDPAWLSWNNATVARLAQQIYDQRAFDRLPVLADALEEAGCSDPSILTHFRHPGPHVVGCWPLDLLLGKE